MSSSIRHRGPDDEGFALQEKGTMIYCRGKDTIPELKGLAHIANQEACQAEIGFVHRRLSILDLSKNGHQPMTYGDGRYVITFNGEIYNFKEIRAELEKEKYSFISNSDTEVILAAYCEWGEQCVDRFIGMWAFAIFDQQERQIFFSRDRFGIKPLYYSYIDGVLIYASEIKAILAYKTTKPQIDESYLFDYLYWGHNFHDGETLYKNVFELPAAHNAVLKMDSKEFNTYEYYQLEDIRSNFSGRKSENEIIEEYRALLKNSVMLHLRSDVPVGACLSGGLDSSALTYFAANMLDNKPFNTFTASYKGLSIDESQYADYVSNAHQNINANFTYPNRKDFWNDFPLLIHHQDLPIGSTSIYAQWEVMKLAKMKETKVLLDGQGADEVLGGYSLFTGIYLIELLKKLRLGKFINEFKNIKNNRSVNVFNELSRAGISFFPDKVHGFIRSSVRPGSKYLSAGFIDENRTSNRSFQNSRNSYTKMSIAAIKYGMRELLRYEDRNSMAFNRVTGTLFRSPLS